jgi:Fuc2NAc and GlcNAc transferase
MIAFSSALLSMLFLVSLWLTGRVRRYALRHDMLDRPNERSSHETPTPRGGGLGFSVLILASLGVLLAAFPDSRNVWIGLLGGGVLIAGIGWLDDRLDLSAKLRMVVHLAAAAWAVYWLGGLTQLELGFATLPLGAVGGLFAVLAVVWSTNLYNFMDGIDGIAGSQAVVVGTTTAALSAALGHPDLAIASGVMAASVAGFLVWNWPPAKIFMGDCGSGLLGFLIAVLALASESRGATPLVCWAMLMSVFWIDATATLVNRVLAGEVWYAAHCSHAYQRAVQMGWSHRRVTGVIVLINLFLSGMAVVGVLRPSLLAPLVAISSGAILLLWIGLTRFAAAKRATLDKLPEVAAAGQRSAA